jgi:polysaccharide export outer membrane protein
MAIVLLVGLAVPVEAKQTTAQQEEGQVVLREPTAQEVFINMRGFSADYEVGPGDELNIQVIGYEEMRATVRVSNRGEISLPMLGLLKVMDMTLFEIEDTISAQLRDGDLINKPEVLVSVTTYNAKPVFVMGAVTTPGQFIMSQALTSSDAILLAGGLRFNAGDEALLHRHSGSSDADLNSAASVAANPGVARPGVEVIKIDLRPIKEGRFNETSIPLRRGDVLFVPDRVLHQFFVVGEVLVPRNYLYTPGKTVMASQAISWASGPTPTAKMSAGMLVRYDAQGNRSEMPVDYAAILKGTKPDFPIQPNDIIFVPGSAVKTLAQGLLMITDSMVMSASFRIARTYQIPEPLPPPDRPTQPPQQ